MTQQAQAPQRGKVNPVTWAVLDVYAGTAEGQNISGLSEHVRANTPRGRLKSTARITAQGLGCLDPAGKLTPEGWTAARAAASRLMGSAGVVR